MKMEKGVKAVIRYRDDFGKRRQATIQVERNEPNTILEAAMKSKKIRSWNFVDTIACGGYEYQWKDKANKAIMNYFGQ